MRVGVANVPFPYISHGRSRIETQRLFDRLDGSPGAPQIDQCVAFIGIGESVVPIDPNCGVQVRERRVVLSFPCRDKGLNQERAGAIGLRGEDAIRSLLGVAKNLRPIAVSECVEIGELGQRPSDLRLREIRVQTQRLVKKADRLVEVLGAHALGKRCKSAHRQIDRIGVRRPRPQRAQVFGLEELDAERIGDARHRLDLQFAELAAIALETVGPDMGAGLGRNQLRVDRDRLAHPADAAFGGVAHAEFAPDLFHVGRLALVGQCGVVGDDETVRAVAIGRSSGRR